MKRFDEFWHNKKVTLIFNGDFNWFNIDDETYTMINEAVSRHVYLKGNVEEELYRGAKSTGPMPDQDDCGCNYPEYVDPAVVHRSNQIISILKRTAQRKKDITLRTLYNTPRVCRLKVKESLIGVVHGDLESLSGWNYSVEALEPLDTELRRVLKVPEMIRTPQERVIRDLHQRGWHGVACTHTCLPMCQDFIDPETGNSHVVINNGSAGMGNFRQSPAGLLTRISSTSHRNALYGLHSRGVFYEALPIDYDAQEFFTYFEQQWPPGSPAHASYASRIRNGLSFFGIQQAARGSTKVYQQAAKVMVGL